MSLRRLNRQIIAVKQREVGLARDIHMQVYEKVREQANAGGVAGPGRVGQRRRGAGEKRAERIQKWPFDEATFARVITIASSAAATIIARMLLDPVGL